MAGAGQQRIYYFRKGASPGLGDFTLFLFPTQTISEVKQAIFERLGANFKVERQKLSYRGIALTNGNQTLQSLNIGPEDRIHIYWVNRWYLCLLYFLNVLERGYFALSASYFGSSCYQHKQWS